MAKHKAASEVTVAPLFEKSAAEQIVDKIKIPAGIVILVIVAWVLIGFNNRRSAARALDASWAAVFDQTTTDPFTRLPTADPEVLASLADSLEDAAPGPWARLLEIHKRIELRDFDGALNAIAQLRQAHPKHELVVGAMPTEAGSATVVDELESAVKAQKQWEADHGELFANAPPASDAPRVTLKTSVGPISLVLYPDRAPKHVENFLKLCGEGYYDGIKFHRVVRGFMIQAGDPNSREDDTSIWGQGGPDYTIPAEESDLYHFAGVLSAAKKPGDTESSGSQFFITTEPSHNIDGQYVVFGAVVDGMPVVQLISEGELAAGTQDRPSNPAVIQSVEVSP